MAAAWRPPRSGARRLAALLLGACLPLAAGADEGGEVHPCREVVVFFEDPAAREPAQRLGEFVCGATRELSLALGLRHNQWARLLLPGSMASWQAVAGPAAGWAAALYTTARRGLVVLRPGLQLSADVERNVTHELVHMLLDRVTAGRLPRWLNEGLAQYLSGDRTRGAPGLPASGDELVALELRWRQPDLDPAERHLDYLRCLALTQRLIERVGQDEVLGQLPAFRHLDGFLEWDLKNRFLRQWLFEDGPVEAGPAAAGQGEEGEDQGGVTKLPLEQLLEEARKKR
ncbi:MAG TPA: hypothetical protein PK668_15775 [Myxococcota bacterium]|nr:hypothetical protein [Myxococcota bacterium]HRY94355.1 hypothetical protein [Myxococcota bacterium]HSA23612.1 hypothetical protein [Myxococcota bacterium]